MTSDARGRAPIPESFPGQETLIAMNLALTAELAGLRERLDTVERLLLNAGAIDAFIPDEAATAERDRLRRRLIDRVFGVLKRDGQARAAMLAVETPGE